MDIYDVRNLLNNGKTIYDIPLKVVFYARVSTEKDDQLNSLKNQVEYFKKYIADNKFWCYIDGYIDEGISGKNTNKREDFMRMISDAKRNRFDLIITKEISRFSRSTIDSIKYTQELLKYGVGVLFQSDNINTLYPDSELRLTIMSSIAQEELRKLSDRTKFGFKRSIEQGRVLGNNNIWGFDKVDGKLYINEKESEIIRFIFDTYVYKKVGLRSIVQELNKNGFKNREGNIFCVSTVRRIITNPKYKGYYCGKKTERIDYKFAKVKQFNKEDWIVYKDENIPQIVSEKLWDTANEMLIYKSKKHMAHEGTRHKYPLSCKIVCGEHDVSYQRTIYRNKIENREVWQCERYKMLGKDGCDLPVIYTSEIHKILKNVILDLKINKQKLLSNITNALMIDENKQNYEKLIIEKEQEKINIKKLKNKLLQLNTDGIINDIEFQESNNKYNEDILDIDKQIEKINLDKEVDNSMKVNIEKIIQFLEKELDLNQNATFDTETIDSFLDKIIVKPESTKEIVKLQVILKIGNTYEALYDRHNIDNTLEIKPLLLSTGNGHCKQLREVKFERKYGNTPFKYDINFIIEYGFVA
jgi:DNA invertase Pin-like site-specific DNA recombinase